MCTSSCRRLLFVHLVIVCTAFFGDSRIARGQKATDKPKPPPSPPATAPVVAPPAAATPAPPAAKPVAPPAAPAVTPPATPPTPPSAAAKPAPTPPEPRLRFQFRFQRWADVLEWFAHEADLSLVLDAPPPGTFNYSDTRDYTPAEAIDLLNGVLQTKGYTLIRRGRMLLVINLKGGLQEGVVPQITLDELDKRGKFELVTVRFPLGRRAVDTVVKEITPLLGPYAKVVPLPTSAQVQVTDAAGVMRSVKAIIDSIVEPQTPAPTAAEALVLATYPIKPADPQTVLATFRVLFPATKVAYDEQGGQLHVYALPSEQATAKKLMDDMRSGNSAEKSRLELYAIGDTPGRQVLGVLKSIVPKAILALDPKAGKIAAWAPPGDHETIKQTIAKLSGETVPGRAAQFEVYRLAGAEPTSTLQLLQSTLPEAKLSLDPASGNLLAWATPAEHQRLAAALAKLGAAFGKEEVPRVEVFRLTKANPTLTLQLLQTLAPRAKLSLDATANSIVALANAEDRKIIQETITRMQAAQPDPNARELSFHVFKQQPPAELLTILGTAVPYATIRLDGEGKRLTIVAAPEDQAFLKSLLDRYEKIAPPEDKNQLAFYSVTPEQKTRFQAVMTTLATDLPGIKIVADAESSQLAIWAKPEQHAMLRGILEQLRQEPPPERKFRLVVYSLQSADPANVLTLLASMFPDAKLVPDKKTRKIAVWARPADHAAIAAAIGQLDAGPPANGTERVQSHVSPTTDPTVAIGVLEELLPHVKFQIDAKSNTIFARAVPRDQELIRRTLDEMRVENAPENKARLEVYSLDVENATPLVTLLQSLLPTAKITIDAEAHSIAVWGTKKDHETVREAIGKFGGGGVAGGPLETARQVEVYPLTKADPASTLALLKTLIPKARLAIDPRTQRLIVVATLADHKVVRGTLEQLQPDKPGLNDPELRFYALKKPAPATIVTGLQALAPAAQITLETAGKRLMVIAPPAEQDLIKKNVDRFEQAAEAEGPERLIVCPLKTADPATVVATLSKMFPHAEWTADKRSRRIVVLARPADQEAIRAAIEQLNTDQPGESHESLMVYPVHVDPKAVAEMLQELLPDMQFTVDVKTQAVLAKGTQLGQKAVTRIVERMNESDERLRPGVATYSTGKIDPTTLRTLLAQLVPAATVTADPRTHVVVALATPKEHEAIRAAVDKLAAAEPVEKAPTVASYVLRATGAAAAIRLLANVLPEAQFAVGSDPSQLIAHARPADQAIIKAAVEQMESEGLLDERRVMAVYAMPAKDVAALTQALDPTVLKNAKIAPLPGRDGLLVWAEPAQQKAIKKTLEDFKRELPKAMEPTAKVYRFRWADPRSALTALTALLPNARIALDADARTLVATALPEDHEKIAAAVREIDQEDPATSGKLRTYSTGKIDPTTLRTLLAQLVPGATVTADPRTHVVIALATPKEHEAIQAAVARLAVPEPPETAPTVASYVLRATGAAAAAKLLATVLPEAQFTVGSDPSQLIAYARPADQAIIKAGVAQMESEGLLDERRVMAVYAMPAKDAASLTAALDPTTLKNAKITPLPGRDGLLVWAEPAQQKAIKKTLEDFQRELPKAMEPTARVYRFRRGDPKSALTALTALLPNAKLAVDANARTLVASALPEDHEKIAAAVREMDQEDPATDAKLRVHRVASADPQNLLTVLQTLFKARPEVQISLDAQHDAIVAVATHDEQEIIGNLIQQVEKGLPGETGATLEVYSLQDIEGRGIAAALSKLLEKQGGKAELSVEPFSRQLVALAKPEQHRIIRETLQSLRGGERNLDILQLETLETPTAERAIRQLFAGDSLHGPDVDVDPATDQVFVRGTPEQLKKIRELLIKMGETGLKEPGAAAAAGPMRTVPFRGDAKNAVEEIQRLWPQLRKNPLRVVAPAAVVPLLRQESKPAPPAQKSPPPAPPASENKRSSFEHAPSGLLSAGLVGLLSGQVAAGSAPPAAKPNTPTAPSASPVLMAVSGDNIIIASDDREALDQMESLLRMLSRQSGGPGRNHTIYVLKHAVATKVAETLQQLFRTGHRSPAFSGLSPVVIAADERMNAILVQASRADRATIENYLKIIDAEETPADAAASKPLTVPLRNAKAVRIEQILRTIFKPQLGAKSAGAGGGSTGLFSAELAVDEVTNSLIIVAPPALAERIAEFARSLDDSAMENASREVSIISLKKSSAVRVQKILDLLMEDTTGVRGRASHRP
jgi:type II secretory pathway component GspD/PulD (secretin)